MAFFHPHDELDIDVAGDAPIGVHLRGLEDMAEIEGLDLGLDGVSSHFGGEPVDEVGRVLINAGRKVVRAHRKRGHVGPKRQHPAAGLSGSGAASGGKLDDHP
jgi:hypothetical protein